MTTEKARSISWATWAQTAAIVAIPLIGIWWTIDNRLDSVEAWRSTRLAEIELKDAHLGEWKRANQDTIAAMREGFKAFGTALSDVRREFTAACQEVNRGLAAVQMDIAKIKTDVQYLRRGPGTDP